MKTAKQKLEYLQGLKTRHAQFSDFFRTVEDVENLNDYDDVFEYLQDAGAVEVEIIYYYEAMKYLIEHDTSLRDSLELAIEYYGYDHGSINSELLASLLATDAHREELHELADHINDTFADIEAGEYI